MTDWSFDAWPAVDPANWGEQRHDHPSEQDCHVDLGCGTIKKGRIGIDRYPAPGVNVVMDLDQGRVSAIAPAPGKDAAEPRGNGWRYRTPGRLGSTGAACEYMDYPAFDVPVFKLGSGWDWASQVSGAYTICSGLPFRDNSIESIVSHHALEHIGRGFVPLIDDVYRVLKPGGTFRAITPLFPSASAIGDPTHERMIGEDTWNYFCGHLGDENNPTGCWMDSFAVPYTRARFKMLDKDITARCEPEKHWSSEDVREIRVTLEAVK